MPVSRRFGLFGLAAAFLVGGLVLTYVALGISEPPVPRDTLACLEFNGAPSFGAFVLAWFSLLVECAAIYCAVMAWPPRFGLLGWLAAAVVGAVVLFAVVLVAQAPIEVHEAAVPHAHTCRM
jgi:hypothetical protein